MKIMNVMDHPLYIKSIRNDMYSYKKNKLQSVLRTFKKEIKKHLKH